tara:strand:+ start:257 stop:370 length:114 start_codon:yes stop_codon:yes gene_type:complete
MTCNCQHCNEIKKQLERAEQRQAELFKARSSKLNINY